MADDPNERTSAECLEDPSVANSGSAAGPDLPEEPKPNDECVADGQDDEESSSSRASVSSWLLVTDDQGDLVEESVPADAAEDSTSLDTNDGVFNESTEAVGGSETEQDQRSMRSEKDEEKAEPKPAEESGIVVDDLKSLEAPDDGEDSDSSCRSLEEKLPAHYQKISKQLRQRRRQRLSQCLNKPDDEGCRESSSESVSIVGDTGSDGDSGNELPALLPPRNDHLRPRRLEPDTDADMSSSYFGGVNEELPANLNVIRPEKKYIHTPNQKLSVVLNLTLVLAVVLVVGLGVGHFLGWSEQSTITAEIKKTTTKKMASLRDELSTCRHDLDDDVDEDDQRIRTLSDQNTLLLARVAELEAEIADLKVNYSETVGAYEGRVDRLTLEREVLETALDELKTASMNEFNIEVEQSRQIDSLVGEIKGLKTLIDNMQTREATELPPTPSERKQEAFSFLDSSLFDDLEQEMSSKFAAVSEESPSTDSKRDDDGLWKAFESLVVEAWAKMKDLDAVKKALSGCKTVSEGVAKRFCKLALALNELSEKSAKRASSPEQEGTGEKQSTRPFFKKLWEALREEQLAPDVEWEKVDFQYVSSSVGRLFDDMRGKLFGEEETVEGRTGQKGAKREALKHFFANGAETVKAFAVDFKDRMMGKWTKLKEMASSAEDKGQGEVFVENFFAKMNKLPRVWTKVWSDGKAGEEGGRGGGEAMASPKTEVVKDQPQPAEATCKNTTHPSTADWLFGRAKARCDSRVQHTKSDWMFERAKARRDENGNYVDDHEQRYKKPEKKRGEWKKKDKWQRKERKHRFDDDDEGEHGWKKQKKSFKNREEKERYEKEMRWR